MSTEMNLDEEREDMIAWLMRDQGDDLSPLGRDYTDAEIADMLRLPAQTEPTDAQIEVIADSIESFFEEHVHMARRLYPDVWKRDLALVVLKAVRAAQGEPSDTTPEGAEVTFFTQLDSDYAEESATLAQAEHVRREASGLIPPAGRKITKRVTYWVDMPAAFTAGQEDKP